MKNNNYAIPYLIDVFSKRAVGFNIDLLLSAQCNFILIHNLIVHTLQFF